MFIANHKKMSEIVILTDKGIIKKLINQKK